MRNLRPDLHAIQKILAGEVGRGIADLEYIVAGITQWEDGLGLYRFGQSASACAHARQNVAGHFLAVFVQEAEDRIEKRRRRGRRFDFDRDVGRLIQMEACSMRFAGMSKSAFERAGNLEDRWFRRGAVRFDERLLGIFAAALRELAQAGRIQPTRPAALVPAPFAAGRPIGWQRAWSDL